MDFAWIHHPKLDATVRVPASAVRVWVQSGWQETDPPPPPPKPASSQDAAEQDVTPSRRRRTKDQPAPVGDKEE